MIGGCVRGKRKWCECGRKDTSRCEGAGSGECGKEYKCMCEVARVVI